MPAKLAGKPRLELNFRMLYCCCSCCVLKVHQSLSKIKPGIEKFPSYINFFSFSPPQWVTSNAGSWLSGWRMGPRIYTLHCLCLLHWTLITIIREETNSSNYKCSLLIWLQSLKFLWKYWRVCSVNNAMLPAWLCSECSALVKLSPAWT